MSRFSIDTAVLFLVFNRPHTTARVFESIRQARPPRLYIACDGPREGRPEDAQLVSEVRKIVTEIDWPCELKTLFRSENLGCKYAPATAIDWFFQNEECGIILEDDVLPVQGFFKYCEMALQRYRDDPRVGMVAGHSIDSMKDSPGDVYKTKFTTNALVWGWATWRHTWQMYDIQIRDWNPLSREFLWQKKVATRRYVDMWSYIFNKVKSGEKNDVWDYQLMHLLFRRNLLCVMPPYSLINNIGFGDGATHTTGGMPEWVVDSSELDLDGLVLSEPELDIELDRRIVNKIYGIDSWANIKHHLKKVFRLREFD